MSKFKTSILIIGIVFACVAASLITYLVLAFSGGLVTEPIMLSLMVVDAEKQYDGMPLQSHEVLIIDGELLPDHRLTYTCTGSQTDVGESTCGALVKILDEDDYDVTGEYKIQLALGKLTVKRQSLSVRLDDAEAEYCGEKVIFSSGYTVESGFLASGHYIAAKKRDAGLTNVGDKIVESEFAPAVYDAFGREVTDNYNITMNFGKVEIVKRSIVFKPVSVSKVYDGTPLTAEKIEIVNGSLVEGHTVIADLMREHEAAASMTNVGKEVLSIRAVQIFDRQNRDVTQNYEIGYETAAISVTSRVLHVTARSGEWEYDGEEHGTAEYRDPASAEGLAPQENVWVSYTDRARNAGVIPNTIDVENVQVVKLYLDGSGVTQQEMTTQNYEIHVTDGTLTINKRSVEISVENFSAEYAGREISDAELKGLVRVERKYADLITSSDWELEKFGKEFKNAGVYPLSVKPVSSQKMNNYTFDVYQGNVSILKKAVHVVVYGDDVEYTGIELSEGELRKFLHIEKGSDDKSLVSESYLVSERGGLTFRDAGKYPLSFKWREDLSVEDTRDIKNNYELTVSSGTLTILPKTIDAQLLYNNSRIVEAEYSGRPLDGARIALSSIPQGLAYRIADSNVAQIIDAGEHELTATVAVYERGEQSANFVVNALPVQVIIKPSVYNAKVSDITKPYDGKGISAEEIELNITQVFPNGRTLHKFGGNGNTCVDVDDYELTVKAEFMKEDGTVDKNYEIKVTAGKLTVTQREIKPVFLPCEREYDGLDTSAEFLKEFISLEEYGKILKAEDYLPLFNGSSADAGEYRYTLVFTDEANGLLKRNYKFSSDEGVVTVLPKPVSVSLRNDKKTYDGTAYDRSLLLQTLECETFAVSDFRISSEDTTEIVDAGEYRVKVEFRDTQKQKNYKIMLEGGAVTIAPRPVAGKVRNETLSYTGEALAWERMQTFLELELDRYALPKDAIAVTCSEECRNAGIYLLTAEFAEAATEEMMRNYTLAVSDGILFVMPKEVTLRVVSPEREYDGTSVSSEELNVTGVPEGCTARILNCNTAHMIDAGIYPVEGAEIALYEGEEREPTRNYKVTALFDDITILPQSVNIMIAFTTQEKTYDGEGLKEGEVFLSGANAPKGCEFEIVSSNASNIVNAGSYELTGEVIILDLETGEKNNNYVANVNPFGIEILPADLVYELGFVEADYRGEILSDEEIFSHVVFEGNPDEFYLSDFVIERKGEEFKNAGEYRYSISFSDAVDKTKKSNYKLVTKDQTVRINKLKLSLNASDFETEYCGQSLTVADFWNSLSIGSAPDEFTAEDFKVTSGNGQEFLNAGEYTYSVAFADSVGAVQNNYTLTDVTALLTIRPKTWRLTVTCEDKIYDGAGLSDNNLLQYSKMPEGCHFHSLESNFETIKNVGTYTASLKGEFVDNANLPNPNYAVEVAPFEVTVLPCPVTVTLNPKSKTYDGKPYDADRLVTIVLQGEAPVSKFKITESNAAEIVDAGEYEFRATVCALENDEVSRNYAVTVVEAPTVTIDPKELVLSYGSEPTDLQKVYDGKPFTLNFDKFTFTDTENKTMPDISVSDVKYQQIVNVSFESPEGGGSKKVQPQDLDLDRNSIKIVDADGKVTKNYQVINELKLEVTITKRQIALTTEPLFVSRSEVTNDDGNIDDERLGEWLNAHYDMLMGMIRVSLGTSLAEGDRLDLMHCSVYYDKDFGGIGVDGSICNAVGTAVDDCYDVEFTLGQIILV